MNASPKFQPDPTSYTPNVDAIKYKNPEWSFTGSKS